MKYAHLLTLIVFVGAGGATTFADDGKQAFLDNNCNRCHSVSAHGIEAIVSESMRATDLSSAGKERDADWIDQYLAKNVDADGKKHRPNFRGSDADRRTIADWLAEQKGT